MKLKLIGVVVAGVLVAGLGESRAQWGPFGSINPYPWNGAPGGASMIRAAPQWRQQQPWGNWQSAWPGAAAAYRWRPVGRYPFSPMHGVRQVHAYPGFRPHFYQARRDRARPVAGGFFRPGFLPYRSVAYRPAQGASNWRQGFSLPGGYESRFIASYAPIGKIPYRFRPDARFAVGPSRPAVPFASPSLRAYQQQRLPAFARVDYQSYLPPSMPWRFRPWPTKQRQARTAEAYPMVIDARPGGYAWQIDPRHNPPRGFHGSRQPLLRQNWALGSQRMAYHSFSEQYNAFAPPVTKDKRWVFRPLES